MWNSKNPPFKNALHPLGPWQRVKDAFERVGNLFDDNCRGFLENASIHGLSYLKKPNHSKFKCLWILVIILEVGMVFWLSALLMQRFKEQPLRMTIRSFQTPVKFADFPAITICDNAINEEEMDKLVKELKYEDDTKSLNVKEVIPKMINRFSNLDSTKPLEKSFEKLHKVLTSNGLTVRDLVKRLSIPLNKTFVHCKWYGKVVPCETIFKPTITGYGYCYTFNGKETKNTVPLKSITTGWFMGLSLILNQQSDFLKGYVKIFIHNNDRLPWITAASIIYYVSPFVAHITLIPMSVQKMNVSEAVMNLPIESRRCVIDDEIHLQNFEEYQPNNCMIECAMNASLELCGCSPYNTPVDDERVCNIPAINCLSEYYNIINAAELVRDDPDLVDDLQFIENENVRRQIKGCHCWNKCSDLIYSQKSDIVPSNAMEFDRSGFSDLIQNNSKQAIIHIYMGDQVMRETEFIVITDALSLIYNLGGVFSLCLGCSLLTCVEIIYYCIFKFCKHQYKDFMRKERVKRSVWFKDTTILKDGDISDGIIQSKEVIIGPSFYGDTKNFGMLPKRKLSYIPK